MRKMISVDCSTIFRKDSNIYNHNKFPYGISFGLITSPKSGRELVAITRLCREQLTDVLRASLLEGCSGNTSYCSYYDKSVGLKVDWDVLRLLIVYNSYIDNDTEAKKRFDSCKSGLFAAKKLINLLEESVGWKRSKITTVSCKGVTGQLSSPELKTYLLTAPGEWIKSPHLLSLLTLFLRAGICIGDMDFESVEEYFYKLDKMTETYCRNNNDVITLMENKEKFIKIIENSDTIFTESIEEAYDRYIDEPNNKIIAYNMFGLSSGIMSLVRKRGYKPEVQERFNKVMEEKAECKDIP